MRKIKRKSDYNYRAIKENRINKKKTWKELVNYQKIKTY